MVQVIWQIVTIISDLLSKTQSTTVWSSKRTYQPWKKEMNGKQVLGFEDVILENLLKEWNIHT